MSDTRNSQQKYRAMIRGLHQFKDEGWAQYRRLACTEKSKELINVIGAVESAFDATKKFFSSAVMDEIESDEGNKVRNRRQKK